MNRKEIEQAVEKLVWEIVEGLPEDDGERMEVVDVEYVKERDYYLRVFLDKKSGVELDDCQAVSEKLEEQLDRLDLIGGQYYLEVSSPGLDRELKKEKDFVRHTGEMVDIKLYQPLDGVKQFVGLLAGLESDGSVHIKDAKDASLLTKKSRKPKEYRPAEPKELKLSPSEIASVRLYIDF